jgi:hypothetical protein
VLASLTDGLKMDKLVEQALAKYDKNVVLRPNQLDCLNLLARERKDVIVNLPVKAYTIKNVLNLFKERL